MLLLSQMAAEMDGVEIDFMMVPGDADVGRARNVAAEHFLHSDADVMLTVDADIWFHPLDALKLCREAIEHDVVGGLYMVRSLKDRQPAPIIEVGQKILFAPGEELVPVKYLATGFMAIHRRVFEALGSSLADQMMMKSTPLPFRPFYMQMAIPSERDGMLYLSEDYAFCHRVREEGFGIWLDPTIRLGHVGTYMFRLEDYFHENPSAMPISFEQMEDGEVDVRGYPMDEGITASSGADEVAS